jgi:hypothetical protein
MLKNLLTKKNIYAAVAAVAVAVVAGVIAKSHKDETIEIVVEEPEVAEDIAEEPVVKARPVNRKNNEKD